MTKFRSADREDICLTVNIYCQELPSNDTIRGPTHFQVVVDIFHCHIPAVHDCPLPLSYLEVQYN